jgi:hypothetical protein
MKISPEKRILNILLRAQADGTVFVSQQEIQKRLGVSREFMRQMKVKMGRKKLISTVQTTAWKLRKLSTVDQKEL